MDAAIPFEDLDEADLVVEVVYRGGSKNNISDDPLARLLPVGNQGGFRFFGSPRRQTVKLAVLFSTGSDPDWPDMLDPQTGLFTYYGDNKKPGTELHNTSRGGNILLRDVFELARGSAMDRARVAPFFLFNRAGTGRDVRFRGLLAPGGETLVPDDELQAVWRSSDKLRFQNYRARFTVLDVAKVERSWINEVIAGDPLGPSCPAVWREWVEGRSYRALVAPSTRIKRSAAEQRPADAVGKKMVELVHSYFSSAPHAFEKCAVEIWRMLAPATGQCQVTRPSADGGRDAVGEYLLGPAADQIKVEFALEAKCWAPGNAVTTKEIARLISRIRHRQFGVFITTSHFHHQAYEEVREDGHPIVLVCGADIVDVLRSHGYGTLEAVRSWLEQKFPLPETDG